MKAEHIANRATRKFKAVTRAVRETREATRAPAVDSFAKGLFLGQIGSEMIFPYPKAKPEEQEMLAMTLDAVEKLGKEIDVDRIEEEKRIPEDVLRKLRDMGLFGLIIPEAYGGAGFSTTAYVQVLTAVGVIDTSLTATLGAHQSIGLKAILMHGSDAQKEAYLPKLASGEWLAAFGLTEPGAGSDARSLKTTAELSEDGKHYVLNGNKIWITNGGLAHVFTVFARTFHPDGNGGKKERITCFIVTRDMEGFSSGPEEKKLGLWGSSTTSLHFENVKVPIENVIGAPGEGFKIAMSVLNNGRLGLAGACALGSKALVQLALDHALQRKQFGKPLADFGLIQSKFANMVLEMYAAEAMVRVTANLMDRGDTDYSLETAMCKVFSTEMEWRICNETLQIAGGSGYMKEYKYEKSLRDSRIFTIWEGANEILRLFIGLSGVQAPGEQLKVLADTLKKPLEDVVKSLGVLGDFSVRWIQRRVATPGKLTGVDPQLSRETALFEKYTAIFAAQTETTLLRQGKNIIHNEQAVRRIADIAIDLFAMACVLSRATDDLARGGKHAEQALPIARAFFRKARRRVAENLRRMERNDDDLETKIAKHLYEQGGFTRIGAFA